ncbi:hypothetical protein DOY81_002964 [Sarcophaga bullata]|nr:hypothetical protein DOY81_002964 [Sarcophaga bullata]
MLYSYCIYNIKKKNKIEQKKKEEKIWKKNICENQPNRVHHHHFNKLKQR